ncbi:unknown [Anaerotruncus sp. CAG:390]|nr:unknown [Anaerotruncus sp. CAG:390]
MTKRALIIISVLVILPIVVTLVALASSSLRNHVVAEWCDDKVSITYKGETYHPVGKVGERLFGYGKYLGKIGSSTYGAPLYTVKDDTAGYLCYATDTDKLVLLSKTGEPLDGLPDGSAPSEIKLGKTRTSDESAISELRMLDVITDPEKVTDRDDLPIVFSTKKYKGKYIKYKIWDYWGDSAVALDSGVRLFHMTETDNWYYVTAKDAAQAEAEEDARYYTYTARPLKDKNAIALIEKLTFGESADTTGTADETTAPDTTVYADTTAAEGNS